MASKNSGVNMMWVGIVAAVLALLILAFYVLPSMKEEKPTPPTGEEQISYEQFQATLMGASEIALVMDVRDSPDNATREAIFQCGVNLARSLATQGKKIKSYSYDYGEVCYTYEGNMTGVQKCEEEVAKSYAFIVSYGPASTTFYRTKTIIQTNRFYGSACSIDTVQEQPVEYTPPEISPNVTAETAGLTREEIFASCTIRDYCASQGPEEEQQCLKASGSQIFGDARCCFGIHNSTQADWCIDGSAGVLHGANEDYCQFVSSPEMRDSCYFKYATRYFHAPYCEPIVDPALKDDCYSELE